MILTLKRTKDFLNRNLSLIGKTQKNTNILFFALLTLENLNSTTPACNNIRSVENNFKDYFQMFHDSFQNVTLRGILRNPTEQKFRLLLMI